MPRKPLSRLIQRVFTLGEVEAPMLKRQEEEAFEKALRASPDWNWGRLHRWPFMGGGHFTRSELEPGPAEDPGCFYPYTLAQWRALEKAEREEIGNYHDIHSGEDHFAEKVKRYLERIYKAPAQLAFWTGFNAGWQVGNLHAVLVAAVTEKYQAHIPTAVEGAMEKIFHDRKCKGLKDLISAIDNEALGLPVVRNYPRHEYRIRESRNRWEPIDPRVISSWVDVWKMEAGVKPSRRKKRPVKPLIRQGKAHE
jgi:hypothetical protein